MTHSRETTYLTILRTEFPFFRQMFVRIIPSAKICSIEFIRDGVIAELMPINKIHLSQEMEQVYNQLKNELNEYFIGNLFEFSVPLFYHGTQFQIQIWNQIRRIPYGKTISYLELTQKCGFSNQAVRVVAYEVGQNPIPIIIPCHRVIGMKGELTGYRGGIDRKRELLKVERVIFA